jgi:hypothetical protein
MSKYWTEQQTRQAVEDAQKIIHDMGGTTEAEMAHERALDEKLAVELGESGRIGSTGRHTARGSTKAFMARMNDEGPGLLTEGAKSYWDDQRRLYPHLNPSPDRVIPSTRSMRNRLGRVTERTIFHNDGTQTVLVAK